MDITSTIATVFSSMLLFATPLIFTALGGTFSERSGIVNVGLEGIMTMGAFTAIVANIFLADTLKGWTPWVAFLIAGVVGVIFSLIHAVATVNFRADHVVSGIVINLLAPALAIFLTKFMFDGKGQTSTISRAFNRPTIPVLKDIPFVGRVLFTRMPIMAYVAVGFAILSWILIYKTKFGLHLRSVGEHPLAADTLGINVYLMRYSGVMLSGLLGGFGGAVVAQTISLNFSHATIAGQGFMALAAMIFGKWNPLGAMGAALFFGFAQSLATIGNFIPLIRDVPPIFLQIAPYVLTIVILLGFIGKAEAPAADGETYIKAK